jgi:hypothetical protein
MILRANSTLSIRQGLFSFGKMRVSNPLAMIWWTRWVLRHQLPIEDLRCLLMGHWKWYSLIRYLQGVSPWMILPICGGIALNLFSKYHHWCTKTRGCNNPDKCYEWGCFQIHWHRKFTILSLVLFSRLNHRYFFWGNQRNLKVQGPLFINVIFIQ